MGRTKNLCFSSLILIKSFFYICLFLSSSVENQPFFRPKVRLNLDVTHNYKKLVGLTISYIRLCYIEICGHPASFAKLKMQPK